MMRSCVAILSIVVALISVSTGVRAQTVSNSSGNWTISPIGEPFTTGTVRLKQDGLNVVGSYGQSGKIEGKFEPDRQQVDANWTDARGTGWMTIVFAAGGNRFSGDWGRPGTRPSGHFSAVRYVYPNVTGSYNASVTGAPEFAAHRLSLRQLGLDVVGNYGPETQINGSMATDSNAFTGTWKGPNGNGWIKLQFADDSKSFAGTWGISPDGGPSGQIVGGVGYTNQISVRGLWQIASSGPAFSGDVLQLAQRGHIVQGSFRDGHLQGTLLPGSHSLSCTWRDSRGTGACALKFSPDGMSFQGSWTAKSKNSGSIIGKRVLAAMRAVRP